MRNAIRKITVIITIVSAVFMSGIAAYAAKADSIADFIKENCRGADIVINTPKYDQDAKVFFLFYLGYNMHQQEKLESATKPLIPVYKKMAGKGAELLMYLDFPPDQNDNSAKNKKGKSRNKKAGKRSLAIKCPVINVFHDKAREALFKADARGKKQSYGTYDLRATDANGVPLAYFSYENGEITMRDAATGEKKSVADGSYNGNEWVGPAILASYEELVAKVAPEEDPAETQSAESGDDAEKQPSKKRKKKSSKKSKQV